MKVATAQQVVPAVKLHVLKDACAQCSARELCLPLGLTDDELQRLDEIVGNRQKMKRGEHYIVTAILSAPFTPSK